jgi:hypothetical protein
MWNTHSSEDYMHTGINIYPGWKKGKKIAYSIT